MNTYWQKRAEESVQRWESIAGQYVPELIQSFERARRDINGQVMQFYAKYAADNKVTLAEAQRALTAKELFEWHGNLKEYEKLAKESIGTYNLELENMSTRARVTRLQALQFDIDTRLQELYQEQRERIENAAKEVIEDSYYHAQYDISQHTGYLYEFAKVPSSFVNQVLSEPVMGADISTRLWRQDIDTGFRIRQTLNVMFAAGRPPQDFAEELQKAIGAVRYDENGNVSGTGKKYEAYRLLYNEAGHAAEQAKIKAYQDDGIEEYEIVASLDKSTCSECGQMDSRHFKASEAAEGENCPLFHVNCRCTTVPYLPSLEEIETTRMARDPVTGKSVRVTTQSYEEWKKQFESIAAKESTKNTGARLIYNPKADFSIKLSEFSENVQMGMSKASNTVAKLGGNDGLEHMILVDMENGSFSYQEDGQASSVGGSKFWEFIRNNPNKKFAFIHNHNTDGCFSETDMSTLLGNNNIAVFVASRIDGVRYIAIKRSNPPHMMFDLLYEKELAELNKKSREGIISGGERTRMREEIIVNNLLRDYTKGLIELEG